MAHNVKPNQKVRIMTIEVAVPADLNDGSVEDKIAVLLSENGTQDDDGIILDWSYTGEDRIVQADGNPYEGEVFRLPAAQGI